jgi:hypothetical protein
MAKNPILTVLSVFLKRRVKCLLMGGQACILYGAAEFTRDTDFFVLCDDKNLERIKTALRDLKAVQVFFPPLEARFLQKGHACHFVCGTNDTKNFRIDIMSRMRGCPDFKALWAERKFMRIDGMSVPVLSLRRLVLAKKTQRDKDWPMIRRLVEIDYHSKKNPDASDVRWWLFECRTPELLSELYEKHRSQYNAIAKMRPLLKYATEGNRDKLEKSLMEEELEERHADRIYWDPLKKELEGMRHGK